MNPLQYTFTSVAIAIGLSGATLLVAGCGGAMPADNPSATGTNGTGDPVDPGAEIQPLRPTPIQLSEVALDNARALEGQGMQEEALLEFERAISINPELAPAWVGSAAIYHERGDFGEAERRFRKATEIDDKSFEAWSGHGLALQMLSRLSEAVISYLRALEIRPDDFEANKNLALAYLQMGEPGEGLVYARRAVQAHPQDGIARANLGAIYAAMDRHADAVIEFQQAVEFMEITPEIMLNLADSLGRMKRYEEMLATLDRLVEIEPSPAAYERIASAYFRTARYTESQSAFRTALDLDPDYYPALNGVGVCRLNDYILSGKRDTEALDEAVKMFRHSLRVKRNQPQILELITRYRA